MTRNYIPPAIYRDFDKATASILDGKLDLNDPRFSDIPAEDSPRSEPKDLDEANVAELPFEPSESSSSEDDNPIVPMLSLSAKAKGKGKARAIVLSSDEEPVEQRGPLTRARAAKTALKPMVGEGGESSRKRARSESLGVGDPSTESPKAKRVRIEVPPQGKLVFVGEMLLLLQLTFEKIYLKLNETTTRGPKNSMQKDTFGRTT